MKKIVIGLSGGLDSTTLLGLLLVQGFEIHACSFTYGSKHNQYENEAVKKIIDFYVQQSKFVHLHEYDLSGVFNKVESNLLKTGGQIPEGHYEDDSMKLTVVPGRNMIFASIMASLAESIGAEAIALGVHAGDHHIYPDCRPQFIEALKQTIEFSTDHHVSVYCPLLLMNKSEIVQKAIDLKAPLHLTRTCYKDQAIACGKCGSCQERLEAFSLNHVIDPIGYE